jgi:indolepyruvate ferredoxin oxidoreductase
MAYKDEYEVARLHLLDVERARAREEFGEDARFYFMLHPPLLRALGLKRKLKLGRWFVPAFKLLRASKWLRGTPLDIFGYAKVRRVERKLIGEYEALVAEVLERVDERNRTVALALLGASDMVRGYEEIKLANVERWRARLAQLRPGLEDPSLVQDRRDAVSPILPITAVR